MITFFRRIFSSKLGLALTFALLILIAVAFAASDITGTGMFGGGQPSGTALAKVGDREIGELETARQVENQLESRRQSNPALDMLTFIRGGGFEGTLDQLIDIRALEAFAMRSGIAAGKRLVDGEIASIPAFFGPTGAFDRGTFLATIQQRRLTEQQVRADIASGLIARQVQIPAFGAARFPIGLVRPYAALALEGRTGLSAFVPVTAMPAGAPPSEPELAAFYTRNIARYTVPERRVIRYAVFGGQALASRSAPTDAEIADFYRQNAARYAASETRTLTQVILQDQAAARTLETKVRGGTAFAAAAAQAGLEPAVLADQTQAGFAGVASPAVANAAFAAAQGAILSPQRSPLGWHVVRVDAIKPVPGRSLDQVRAEIAAQLGRQKLQVAIADLTDRIEDAIADGGTFDEIVKANGLQVVTTPPITASGADPDNPQFRPDATFARFLAPMFEAESDDEPMVETLIPNEQYALSDLDRVVPAAPRPLAQIRAQVAQDFVADRAWKQTGDIARAITAKVSRGTPLAQAAREAGVALPAPKTIGGRRRELTASGQPLGPDVRRLFEMAQGTAKRVEAPERTGWYVVQLQTITPGNLADDPALVARMQADFNGIVGREYSRQLANAAKAEIGVSRNEDAIGALKRRLSGVGGQ